MSISRMDLDLLVSFIVGPSSIVLVLLLLGVVIKQFYANLNYSRARQRRQAKPHEINLVPTHVPFTFELKSSSVASSSLQSDGSVPDNNRTISIEVTTTTPKSKTFFFWGINAKPFLDTLLTNSTSWTSSGVSDIDNVPLWVTELQEFYGNLTTATIEGASSTVIHVEIPESVRTIRGSMTKQLIIPCVAVLISDDNADDNELGRNRRMDPTDIKGLIVVYQLNSLEQRNSVEIRDRFIKTVYGFSCRLMSLYLQGESENPSSADTDDQELFKDRRNPLNPAGPCENQPFYRIRCTLCQTLPISRAIVPCGHLCTCAHCFAKVKSCPICRGHIQCFFKTRDESYMNSIPQFMKSTDDAKPRRLTWGEYFEEISEQLNIMLGLPEAV